MSSQTGPAAASNLWVVESGKATGLWGVGMFVATMCSKAFGLHPAVATLAQRTGDFLTALILVGPQINAAVLRSQSALGMLCGLATGLLTTGASTYYNRALVMLASLLLPVPASLLLETMPWWPARQSFVPYSSHSRHMFAGGALTTLLVCGHSSFAGCGWRTRHRDGIDVSLSGDNDCYFSVVPL